MKCVTMNNAFEVVLRGEEWRGGTRDPREEEMNERNWYFLSYVMCSSLSNGAGFTIGVECQS